MIGKLKGRIDVIYDNRLIIDVGGVGYLVYAGNHILSKFGAGDFIELSVETIVREDSITLYGFAGEHERAWFRLLTSVQGVGAKAALAILSVCPPDNLSVVILSQDKTALTRADGIGAKIATRIVSELKDKVNSIADQLPISKAKALPNTVGITNQADSISESELKSEKEKHSVEKTSDDNKFREREMIINEAVLALVNLGYQRSESYKTVSEVIYEIMNSGDYNSGDQDAVLGKVIKDSLKKIGRI